MRIVWSATAIANLTQIKQYIEQDKPEAARRTAQKILSSAERLAKHPHLSDPGREAGTRELGVPGMPYIISYTIRRGTLAILAILHTSRNLS
jgi:toxin ParE1/3/4